MASSVEHYRKRLKALESERGNIVKHWQEISDHILGFRGRFLVTDRNKAKRNTKILNNTGRLAARTLASGMMAGITSPARPWFQLGTLDPELAEFGPVKFWLHDVQLKMREVFAQSNLYNSLHALYAELGSFATAPVGIYFDYENIIRAVPYTAGSYFITTNGRGEVDTFYRKYQQTVAQVVREFGIGNVSESVQQNWRRGNTESWVDVIHVIEPDDDMDGLRPGNMAYRSVYMEERNPRNQFLREAGFEEFPILCPRWELAGDDIYGTSCPGMDALGDVKAMQLHERRHSQAVDKVVDPPTQVPMALQNQVQGGGFMPGDMTFVPDTSQGIKSIYDLRPDLNAIESKIAQDEFRVKRAYYEDLFLMLANTDRRQITAREIEEKHEEKLLMLGPVLERLHNELLNPLIKRTFRMMTRAGVLPPAPPEMQSTDINVEYISVLAQAQRLTAINGIERLATYAMSLAQVWPEARHKVNPMESIDEYARAVGTAPSIIREDKDAEALQQQEQQQQMAAQMAEQAPGVAGAAKDLSETDVDSASALTRAMGLA